MVGCLRRGDHERCSRSVDRMKSTNPTHGCSSDFSDRGGEGNPFSLQKHLRRASSFASGDTVRVKRLFLQPAPSAGSIQRHFNAPSTRWGCDGQRDGRGVCKLGGRAAERSGRMGVVPSSPVSTVRTGCSVRSHSATHGHSEEKNWLVHTRSSTQVSHSHRSNGCVDIRS